ncbi:heme peroxidase [Rhizophagus irregularis]|uniref:Heme peroxidase n=1 Tax=Rhizophagus irregularis TaxID=588596 RepID=A0A2N0PWN4_9GLOM|nr:heme peroxidase [Rhizophagus irregularis]PKC64416.1 heme peroxidase [Rhizophagus irregularis]
MYNKINKILFYGILVYFSLFKINNAQQYRTLDGTNNNLNVPNAGVVGAIYLNYKNAVELFADSATASMVICPQNYQVVALPVVDKCTDVLQEGTFPLPRCISNLADGVQATQAQQFDESFVDSFKSKRKSSHMMTFWADFISFDISYSQNVEAPNDFAILIPNDDANYLSENAQINQAALPFSRSYNLTSRGTVNLATAYVDGSMLYGVDETRLNEVLRDSNNRCKMRLTYGESGDSALGYLPKDTNGNYIYGQNTLRGTNIFVDMIITVFLREHNKRCDNLTSIHGNDWNDETYFQEARKWTIALIQKINYLEYLSILMGSPLPEFTTYNPDLTAGIDYVFITTTMRYGHSEISNNFNIANQNGEILSTLPLQQTKLPVETFGVPIIATSLALQRQEEIDIFYADYMRGLRSSGQIVDLASVDHLRVRDRGVPYYNDIRELYGFPRAQDFSDITKNDVIQERLKKLYSSVDKIEALVGGLAEEHYNNSNFGKLFQKSMQEQWTLLRDADRFWFESPDAGFTRQEIEEIRNTTWRDVILRNTPADTKLPENIWFVQPRNDLSSVNSHTDIGLDADGYSKENSFQISKIYSIKWKVQDTFLYLKMRIESDNAWFGIGFNPRDDGMLDADFLIVHNVGNNIQVGAYRSNGYEAPIIGETQFVEKLSGNVSSGFMEVQVRRPLNAPERLPIANDTTSVIFAWNPNSNALSYHGGNRGKAKINFFQAGISTSSEVSIIVVRYMKHNVFHLKQHKNLQIIGGVGVFTFGTAAVAVSHEQSRTPHKFVGILLYSGIFFQLGLGLLSLWARSSLVSSNHGIFKSIKATHFFIGVALMLGAAFNVWLGIDAYGQSELWSNLYLGWVGILCVLFIGLECWYMYKNKEKCFAPTEDGSNVKRIIKHIDNKKYEGLPEISWNEIYQRVLQGAKLVVAEELVFDIRRWIDVHPGGAKVLKHVIGTDISNDFFGNKQDGESELFSQGPSLSKGGIVNFFERLNRKCIKSSPGHHHSRFATETLANMVVGKMQVKIDKIDEFKRHTIYDIIPVTKNDTVLKFIFNDPKERFQNFLPGDYLQILSHTQGQTVVRPYTILKEKENRFSIIVKIYKNGVMTQHLKRLLIGFAVKIRGPININERIGVSRSVKSLSMSSILSTPVIADKALLNPNSDDGCWDILFMICRGTGITPMLQLIEYHLEKLNDKQNNTQLFLLFSNETELDIILEPDERLKQKKVEDLEELENRSNGKLKITRILSNKLDKLGDLSHDVIFSWLSKNYTPNNNGEIISIPSSITHGHTSYSSSSSILKKELPIQEQQQIIYEPTKYVETLSCDPVALRVFVCGPSLMMSAVNEAFSKMMFPEEKIITID